MPNTILQHPADIVRVALRCIACVVIAGCGGGSDTPPSGPPAPPTIVSVSIAPSTLSIAVGATGQVTATVVASNGPVAAPTVTWSSSTPSVATVSGSGATAVVTAVAPGSSVITATSGSQSATMSVTVPIPPPPPVASITLSPPLITLDEGGTATFAATLRDAAGTVLTGRTIAWSSSDTTVGTVSSAGTVTGIAEGDTIIIRATSEGQSATARVVVLSPYFIATSFSTQRYHTCAVRASGGTWCWGDFFHGRLGNPANTTMGTKMRVATTEVFVQVAAGQDNSCALTATGRAWCWGWSNGGANGDGVANLGVVQTPTAVVGNLQFVEIHAGASVACGITAARLAYCWGLNGNGVLGTGTGAASNPSPQPVVGLLPFATYAMQFSHVCGITTSAQALCWGFGGLGNIGDGSFNASRSTPTAVSGGRKYVSIAAGYQHSCAIDDAGAAWCWGKGGFGQLGDGGTGNQFVPVRVSGNAVFTQVVTGDTHSCALTTAGDTWCWGRNQLGQLGTGSTASSLVPVPVVGAPKFARLFAAEVHTCGITSQRRVYCWGNNSFGQLGAAPSAIVNVPTALTRP